MSPTVQRAVTLYDVLRTVRPGMRLSDLSRSAALPKSTTHRLLQTLIEAGLVVRCGDSYAAIDPSDDEVPSPQDGDLLRRLAPYVGELMVRTRLTASLATLDGPEVVFAHRVYGHDLVRTRSDETGRALAHRTAAGRMLMANDLRAAAVLTDQWNLPTDESVELQQELLRIRERKIAVEVGRRLTCLAVAVPIGARPLALTVRGAADAIDHHRVVHLLYATASAAARSVRVAPGR
jgi:DNA-binding IclR family transcriptional regulator